MWANEIRGIKFGSADNFEGITFAVDALRAKSNTGVECIIGPIAYINWLRSVLVDALVYHVLDENYIFNYYFKCSEYNMRQLPPLYFLFGDYWFEVDPKHYVM